MKRIAAMMLIALLAAAGAAAAQGPPPPPPPDPAPGPLADPELARLTTDIVVLRVINRVNATPEQLRQLAEVVRGLTAAERDLRDEARAVLAEERERLLEARPGEQPPPGDGMEAIRSLVEEFRAQVRAAEAAAQEFLEPEQARAFRLLLAMTRGQQLAERPRDGMRRSRGEDAPGPGMGGPPPPPPEGGERPLRERIRDRAENGRHLPRPPVPLQRVLELIEEKIAALED